MEKESIKSYFIPENFEDGFVLFSSVYEYKEIGFSLFISALNVILVLSINTSLSKITKISTAVTIGFTTMVISLLHINGNSLLIYMKLVIRFLFRKSRYYYNPRIKKENSDAFFFQEMMITGNSTEPEKTIEFKENTDILYFREDKSYVGKPYEYMNFLQKWKYRKNNNNKDGKNE